MSKGVDGNVKTNLRLWSKDDIEPQPGDIFQERLYCIQWITKESIGRGRFETYFTSVSTEDQNREARVSEYVSKHLAAWQKAGFVSEMKIETGKENEGPIRTMGWSWWHQIHNARQLLQIALTLQAFENSIWVESAVS